MIQPIEQQDSSVKHRMCKYSTGLKLDRIAHFEKKYRTTDSSDIEHQFPWCQGEKVKPSPFLSKKWSQLE